MDGCQLGHSLCLRGHRASTSLRWLGSSSLHRHEAGSVYAHTPTYILHIPSISFTHAILGAVMVRFFPTSSRWALIFLLCAPVRCPPDPSALRLEPSALHTILPHTQLAVFWVAGMAFGDIDTHTHNSFTHKFVTHTSLSHTHTTLSHKHAHTHTTFTHTPLSHTQLFNRICPPPSPLFFPAFPVPRVIRSFNVCLRTSEGCEQIFSLNDASSSRQGTQKAAKRHSKRQRVYQFLRFSAIIMFFSNSTPKPNTGQLDNHWRGPSFFGNRVAACLNRQFVVEQQNVEGQRRVGPGL